MRIKQHERVSFDETFVWTEYFPPFTDEIQERLFQSDPEWHIGLDLDAYYYRMLERAASDSNLPGIVVEAFRLLSPVSIVEEENRWFLHFPDKYDFGLGLPVTSAADVAAICDDLELECATFRSFMRWFGHQRYSPFWDIDRVGFLELSDSMWGDIEEDGLYVPFYSPGDGDILCIDNENCDVHSWLHETGEMEPCGTSFAGFLQSTFGRCP